MLPNFPFPIPLPSLYSQKLMSELDPSDLSNGALCDHLWVLCDFSFQRVLILELLKGQDLCGHKWNSSSGMNKI